MLGDLIGRGLFMILGHAYPAFECFKTVESNNADIHQLRFWCQYWIIVAVLSVCERFGDVFISWLPLYGEMKLAFIIYLWYPNTKGTSYVYESILRPLVSRHETDIDKQLTELRFRAWDLAIYYYQNCTNLGQSAIFNIIQYVANQSTRLKGRSAENNDLSHLRGGSPPPTRSRFWPLSWRKRDQQPAPSSAPMPATFPMLFKDQGHPIDPTKSKVVQVELNQTQTEYIHGYKEVSQSPSKVKSKLTPARFKFTRRKLVQRSN